MFNNGGLEEEIPFQTAWKFQSLLSIRNQPKTTPKNPSVFQLPQQKMATFLQGGPRIQL